ncbi:MAG TPA: 50S ribosomal protein L5 [Patescibacteria group bacterium]|jgi:large subunit ribosomal protein L5|nr:50S ribosomal protein L5 [Patescibacteria group bacterium]
MAKAAATSTAPRLKALYETQFRKELQAELGLDNVNQVPKLEKIVVSVGTGKHKDDKRFQETVMNTLTKVTGQAPTQRLAKKSIAGFKIRANMGAPVGTLVTLRGARMYEFLDRFANISLPRVRDFHGVGLKFDRSGNYNYGITDQSIFPELSFEETQLTHGMQITFTIEHGSKTASRALLEKFGLPFEKETK